MALGQASYFDANGAGTDDDVTYYDLTTKTGDRAKINGGLFFASAPTTSSGTGLINAFVRVQDGGGQDPDPGSEDGYNTDARPLTYEENSSPSFTKSLLLSDVPEVTIDGVVYYEFRLDINQLNSSNLLSLDKLIVYKSDTSDGPATGTIDGAWFTANATSVYDMDGAGDTSVLLDYALQAGSGKSDMFFYVPKTNFAGAAEGTTQVTLYSEFGTTGVLDATDGLTEVNDTITINGVTADNSDDAASKMFGTYTTNDGFEEWSVSKAVTGAYIGGYKFGDTNGNGVWDVGETGLAGWAFDYTITWETVEKVQGTDIVTVHTVTGTANTFDGTVDVTGDNIADPKGFYAIFVPESTDKNETYTITINEAPKTGWANTYDGDAVANSSTTFTFKGNDLTATGSPNISGAFGVTEQMNFGNAEYGSITGHKYEDSNGALAGGTITGVDGWKVYLFTSDPGATPDLNAAVANTTTSGGGAYSFTGLLPGNYWVVEESKAGWTNVTATKVVVDPLTSGEVDSTDNDFVNVQYGSITGTKYEDSNGALAGGTLTGVGGWKVYLFTSDPGANPDLTTAVNNTTTAADGSYSFTGLLPGNYWVVEESKAGWTNVTATKVVVDPLTSGEVDSTGNDFVNVQYGSITGTKYEDSNGALAGGTLTGVGGWKVYLFTSDPGANPDLTTAVNNTPTAADGSYSFTGLLPGNYWVVEESKAGWTNVTATKVVVDPLTSGEVDSTGNDFVNVQYGSITGTKYEDSNGALAGGTLTGVGGWKVYLFTSDPGANPDLTTAVNNTTTAADGSYSFTGLLPGNYWVVEESKAGWTNVTATKVVVDPLTSGEVDSTGNDFVNVQYGSITGTKYEDSNGALAGGTLTGVGGWKVYLFTSDPGANPDLTTAVNNTTTAADGSYSFTGLLPGNYWVVEESKAGWTNVTATKVVVDPLTSGEVDSTGNDFVNVQYGSITGTKYEDSNGALAGGTLTGVGGWKVYLFTSDPGANPDLTTAVNNTTTAADGSYSFTGLLPGNYWVVEESKAGWTNVTATKVVVDPLTSGEVDSTGNDFVNVQYGSITGTKYEDSNGALAGGTLTGVGGWKVYLFTSDPGANPDLTTAVNNTTTAADGSYSFTGLLPGNYWVVEESKAGWTNVTATKVVVDPLTSGEVDSTGNDFVNVQYGSITGTKYEDKDGSAATTVDQVVLSGWKVYLFTSDPGATPDFTLAFKTATTGADGKYTFDTLLPGNYWVVEESKAGWTAFSPVKVTVEPLTSGEVDSVGNDFVNFQPKPAIDIEKSVKTNLMDYQAEDFDDDPDGLQAGTSSTVQFKVVVTNTGNVALNNVTLTDAVTNTVGSVITSQTIVYTTDANAATLDAKNVFIDLNGNGTFQDGEQWANFDTNGDGKIDAGAYAVLDPNESFTIYYELDSAVGQHENRATVTGKDIYLGGSATDFDDANYYVLANEGPGVRTPGFWQNPNNGATFWDGNPNNQAHNGPTFPGYDPETGTNSDILYAVDSNNDGKIDASDAKGLLIGDYNMDGYSGDNPNTTDVVEGPEDTIFIGYDDALKLVGNADKGGNNGTFMLGRDVVATWLNYLAGNNIDPTSSDPQNIANSPHHYLDDAIDWLQQFASNGGKDDDSFATFRLSTVKTSSGDWKNSSGGNGGNTWDTHHSASDIHSALGGYNENGTIKGQEYAGDADSSAFTLAVTQLNQYHPADLMVQHDQDPSQILMYNMALVAV